jgi:hypothetical protein
MKTRSGNGSGLAEYNNHAHHRGAQAVTGAPGFLRLVERREVEDLRHALLVGELPSDFAVKLHHLADESLADQVMEHNCRWFLALLEAARNGSFEKIAPSDVEQILRVLAYVRKEDDAIPDFLPGGYWDDHQEVRAAVAELAPLLQAFKAWRLRHEVPARWWR